MSFGVTYWNVTPKDCISENVLWKSVILVNLWLNLYMIYIHFRITEFLRSYCMKTSHNVWEWAGNAGYSLIIMPKHFSIIQICDIWIGISCLNTSSWLLFVTLILIYIFYKKKFFLKQREGWRKTVHLW